MRHLLARWFLPIRAAILVALVVLSAQGPARADGLPAPMSDTVNDFADLLPPEAQTRIGDALRALREETGVQVVVVTMERMAENGGVGEPIIDYAKRLFNAWGIGDAERDDGILILVARTDREMRIALGAGYPVIWDNAAQRVIDRSMLPEFRADRYAEGIEAGVAATADLIARPFAKGQAAPEEAVDMEQILSLGIFAVFAAGIAGLIFRGPLGDLLVRLRACPDCGSRSLTRRREIIDQPTTTLAGTGVLSITCGACGRNHSERYEIAKSGSGGSSSGGFGGGSSSGGGASGKW